MEPLLFRNGNGALRRHRPGVMGKDRFQWSHFFSEMEIHSDGGWRFYLGHFEVSMEPLLFRNGNKTRLPLVRWIRVSMEPLLFRNGNRYRVAQTAGFQWSHFFSEMEMHKATRVNNLRRTVCFNGATSFQKWKSDMATDLTSKLLPAWFQWSHFFSEMEMREQFMTIHPKDDSLCFNGATSFQKWK